MTCTSSYNSSLTYTYFICLSRSIVSLYKIVLLYHYYTQWLQTVCIWVRDPLKWSCITLCLVSPSGPDVALCCNVLLVWVVVLLFWTWAIYSAKLSQRGYVSIAIFFVCLSAGLRKNDQANFSWNLVEKCSMGQGRTHSIRERICIHIFSFFNTSSLSECPSSYYYNNW